MTIFTKKTFSLLIKFDQFFSFLVFDNGHVTINATNHKRSRSSDTQVEVGRSSLESWTLTWLQPLQDYASWLDEEVIYKTEHNSCNNKFWVWSSLESYTWSWSLDSCNEIVHSDWSKMCFINHNTTVVAISFGRGQLCRVTPDPDRSTAATRSCILIARRFVLTFSSSVLFLFREIKQID